MKKPCNCTICLSPADPSTASLTIARINMRRLNTSESCPMINFGTLPGTPLPRCPSNNGRIYSAALLGAMQGGSAGAGSLGGIARMLGLSSTDPNQMSQDDAARVLDYARKENPDALRQTVQEKPWLVKALGNPVVMGALTLAAAKLLTNLKKKA